MFNFELLLRVVIAALASYRVARMFATERGPFDLFSSFRGWVNIKQAKRHGPVKTWVTDGFSCPLCEGFYIAPVMFAFTYVDFVFWAVVVLAVAGLQTALQLQER